MHAESEHGDGTSVAVVGGIDDQLIAQRHPRKQHRKTIIGLQDSFGAVIRQLSVADENSKAAGIEKRLVLLGNAVDDAGETKRIVVASPFLSGNRETSDDGPVDVGEFVGLFIAIRDSGAGEET